MWLGFLCTSLLLATHAGATGAAPPLWAIVGLAAMALACEYVDSTLGMGYGTALTPILMAFGYAPLDIVPAVLLSELVTGIMAGVMHHRAGNVNFNREGKDLRVALVLAACSIVGTLIAVWVAINISKLTLKIYIGALVLAMGGLILLRRGCVGKFSWKKIVGLGALASFNKGMSGGGYGPVVTCGQILSGVTGKRAVGITSLAEGLTCAVGVVAFGLTKNWPKVELALPLMIGAVLSTPLSAWSVKRIRTEKLTVAIGGVTVGLGLLTLGRALWF